MEPCVVVWYREDLRVEDHPALWSAARRGLPVLPVYVLDDGAAGTWRWGAARRWWLHHSLEALAKRLDELGAPLHVLQGPAEEVLTAWALGVGACELHFNASTLPWRRAQDARLAAAWRERGWEVVAHPTDLLHEPDALRTQGERPYQVFSPFWRAFQARVVPAKPWPRPQPMSGVRPAQEEGVGSLGLLPHLSWAEGFSSFATPGELSARARLSAFLEEDAQRYTDDRDAPALDRTSRLSPHLAHGEVTGRTIWAWAEARGRSAGLEYFVREVGWREFAYHLIYHMPHTIDVALRKDFEAFPWQPDEALLGAWQRGRTGVPLVDAGMRQLWATGWMHNRVRMVVASYLVKHLLQPWQEGARWFWDTLVDADLANNTLGWQWAAGCGADAAPYFRVFNPVLQARKVDPEGAYIARWVPELAVLPAPFRAAPWDAPPLVLAEAGLRLGEHYPLPVVQHEEGRKRALAALECLRARVAGGR